MTRRVCWDVVMGRTANIVVAAFIVGYAVAGAHATGLRPSGNDLATQDLAGQMASSDYRQFTTTFAATGSQSRLGFAFRNDSTYSLFDDAPVFDRTQRGSNLLSNGGFEQRDHGTTMGQWNSFYEGGDGLPGRYSTNDPAQRFHGGNLPGSDGGYGGYDGIDQTVSTIAGDTYSVSSYLAAFGLDGAMFQQTSTTGHTYLDGGDGLDRVVTAGDASFPPDVQEPSSAIVLATVMLGFIGLAGRSVVWARAASRHYDRRQ